MQDSVQDCEHWRVRCTCGHLKDIYGGNVWNFSTYLTHLSLLLHFLTLHYKCKNMLLLGIISGSSEPTHNVNAFLQPLELELKAFRQGVALNVHTESGAREPKIRCALQDVACDLPAGHNFLSHSAALGCSKCSKAFSRVVGSMCFAGFDDHFGNPEQAMPTIATFKKFIPRQLGRTRMVN